MKRIPFYGAVGSTCRCLECQAAGVTDKPRVRVPPDEYFIKSRWLHGEELRAWYDARDRARAELAARLAACRTPHPGADDPEPDYGFSSSVTPRN